MWLEFWSNIAVVWLALLCFATLLVPMIALYFVIRGLTFAQDQSHIWLEKAQQQTGKVRQQTDQASERVAAPLLNAQAKTASVDRFVRSILPGKK